MKTYPIITIILAAVIAVAGCNPPKEEKVVAEKIRTVRVEKIVSRDLPVHVNTVGRLIPNREVILSTQVAGILMAYKADVGTGVAEGEALVTLDPTDYKLALNQAKANLLSAKARLTASKNAYERAQLLLPENVITPELFDQAEAEYKASKALVSQLETTVDIAERGLEKTVVKAPFEGFVAQRLVEVGQNLNIGDPVMAIADLKTMRVIVHLNEKYYVHLDKDDPVTVKIEAYSGAPFPGRVDKIGIKADSRTNTFEVEILVDNPGILLKAGLTARVSIKTEVIHDAIMIAQNCVIFREKGKEVFVVEKGNRAAARKVKLGRVDGSLVRILDGISPGDNLVVTGAQYLKPGDKVAVSP